MNFLTEIKNKLSIVSSIWRFIYVEKKWWLAPLIFMLVLFAVFIVITEGSALAPLIYTLF